MKKEFTEEEIYQVDKDFADFYHNQVRRERKFFFKLLAAVLGLLAIGFLACLILMK